MEKKHRVLILVLIGIVVVIVSATALTFAYFLPQINNSANANVSVVSGTTDQLTFNKDHDLSIVASEENFSIGKGNLSDSIKPSVKLIANDSFVNTSFTYFVHLVIDTNSFIYTTKENTSELILTITDPAGNPVTNIPGLNYVSGSVPGFDVTNRVGTFKIGTSTISATKSRMEVIQNWNITLNFINLNSNQKLNEDKLFSGQLLLSLEDKPAFTVPVINTLKTTKTDDTVSVEANVTKGTNEISAYYYGIEPVPKPVALISSPVKKVANISLVDPKTINFVKSLTNTFSFSNLLYDTEYKILSYTEDIEGFKSPIYETTIKTDAYKLPTITNVTATNEVLNSIKLVVNAVGGTEALNKYYFSVDGGTIFNESTVNTFTFTGLEPNTTYNIVVKVNDINNKYSALYQMHVETLKSGPLVNLTGEQIALNYASIPGMISESGTRFSGRIVNNYVCFGSNIKPCPEDYIYRVIGVFDNKIKLIKSNIYTTGGVDQYGFPGFYWTGSKDNVENNWSTSTLNTVVLNQNFYNSLDPKWQNIISPSTWYVGGMSYNVGGKGAVSGIYPYESPSKGSSTTVNAKIGLMYVSDYLYAASSKHYSIPGRDFGAVGAANDWLFMTGKYEWTISRESDFTYSSFSIFTDGSIYDYVVYQSQFAIRPVFYLLPTIKFFDGSGTPDDPYLLNI